MPRKPTPKKAKKAKPDFVFPPGGAAIAAVPGLRLKPRTGDVPRWWPVDKPGKAAFACNVPGVTWATRERKWEVYHTSATTNKRKTIGYFATFDGACGARASVVDGKSGKGELVTIGGHLCVTRCTQVTCRRVNIPVTEFAPDVFKYKKDFDEYTKALGMLVNGLTGEARIEIEKGRKASCLTCREIQHASREDGEHSEVAKCRCMVQKIKAHWASHGGCAICGCCDADVLSGDHEGRQGKDDHYQRLDANWWAWNGGADAMHAHYLGSNTTVRCLCLFCHSLEESHDFYNGAKLDDLAKGSVAKCSRKYILKKRTHVNAEKLRRGKCEHPSCCDPRTGQPRLVASEIAHAFHFAHKNEVEKLFSIAKIVTNRQSPATAIPKLDMEMPKCFVYCANCHHKYDTIPRRKEGRELLDALLARGAPVCGVCE